MKNLAIYLDLANHKSTAAKKDIENLCQKVLKYGFHSAFVNPCWVRLAKILVKKKAKVGTVISFPLGQDTTKVKIISAKQAIKKGADEIDVSTNVAWLKSGKTKLYLKEMKRIVQAVKKLKPQAIVKFIIEAGYLTEEEKKTASLLVIKSGADFVKTNSGFFSGAELKDVKIIKKIIDRTCPEPNQRIKIKAAGGIKTKAQAETFIKAGVSRIGTSKAVEIVTEK